LLQVEKREKGNSLFPTKWGRGAREKGNFPSAFWRFLSILALPQLPLLLLRVIFAWDRSK
jgi:hypothetical protein